jgi:(1->4)-alpha-D-glucan 1-alpha-D-glucosylmutase
MFNTLAQVVLKTCSPGVPDFYRGTELWDLTLVDPDNRRPIEYELRQRLLAEIGAKSPGELLRDWPSGAVKLFAMTSALRARNKHREIFEAGYRPIPVTGERQNHVIAFERSADSGTIIIVVPRFVHTLTEGTMSYPEGSAWADTTLQYPIASKFENLITGEKHHSLRAAEIFRTFPAAILLTLD